MLIWRGDGLGWVLWDSGRAGIGLGGKADGRGWIGWEGGRAGVELEGGRAGLG